MFLMVMEAEGRGAPEASRTVPVMVASVCAGRGRMKARAMINRDIFRTPVVKRLEGVRLLEWATTGCYVHCRSRIV
jgi:hypothetical protein